MTFENINAFENSKKEVKEITVFGITLKSTNDDLRKRYGLGESNHIVVTDPGDEYKSVGIVRLIKGSTVALVSDIYQNKNRNALDPLDFVKNIIELSKEYKKMPGYYMSRVVLKKPNSPDDQSGYYIESIILTRNDYDELKRIFKDKKRKTTKRAKKEVLHTQKL